MERELGREIFADRKSDIERERGKGNKNKTRESEEGRTEEGTNLEQYK